MEKYKILGKKPINKHKHVIDKYDAYISLLGKIVEKNDNGYAEKASKYYFLQSLLERKKDDYIKEILCLNALERSYMITNDDAFFDLGEVMDEIFDFFVNNTIFSKDSIKEKINNNLLEIELVKEFPDNPNGVGYYCSTFGDMGLIKDGIGSNKVKLLLRHEFTHVLGTQEKNGIAISGYSRKYGEDANSLIHLDEKKNIISKIIGKIGNLLNKEGINVQFDEACVEMFARKDIKPEVKSASDLWALDYDLYTNFSIGSLYIFNSQFVRQMIIANGTSEDELYEGLFDYEASNKVINEFGRRTFKHISKNMDKLFKKLVVYNEIIDDMYDKYYSKEENINNNDAIFKKCTVEEIKEKDKVKSDVEKRIANIERTIIDKILLKKIKNMDSQQRQNILKEYSKFIISEKEYFEKKTGFKCDKNLYEVKEQWTDKYKVTNTEVNKNVSIKGKGTYDRENVEKENVK